MLTIPVNLSSFDEMTEATKTGTHSLLAGVLQLQHTNSFLEESALIMWGFENMVLKAQVQDCIAMFDMKQTLKVAETVYDGL